MSNPGLEKSPALQRPTESESNSAPMGKQKIVPEDSKPTIPNGHNSEDAADDHVYTSPTTHQTVELEEQVFETNSHPFQFFFSASEPLSSGTTLRTPSLSVIDGRINEGEAYESLVQTQPPDDPTTHEAHEAQENDNVLPVHTAFMDPDVVLQTHEDLELRDFQRLDVSTSDPGHQERPMSAPVEVNVGASARDPPLAVPASPKTDDEVANFALQLRRFRTRVDTVLLEGTQWQSQYQKLDNCITHLRNSMDDLMSAIHSQRHMDTSPSSSKSKKRLRKNMETSDDFEPEIELPEDQQGAPSAVLYSDEPALDQGIIASEDSNTAVPSIPNIATLHERSMEDFRSLTQQGELVKGLMIDLSNKQFKLFRLCEDIARNMHSQKFVDELKAEMLDEDVLSPDASSRAPSVPEIVEEYFEAVGYTGVYQERMQELDFVHQESQHEREFLRDQGHEVEVPDEEFEAAYISRRAQMEDDLTRAQVQVQILGQRCKEVGIDPQTYRNAARSTDQGMPSQSGQVAAGSLPQGEPDSEADQQPHPSPPILGQSVVQIEDWLRTLPGDPVAGVDILPPPPPDFEFDALYATLPPAALPIDDRPPDVSMASFEFRSFDIGAFGLPKIQETNETGAWI